MPIQFSSASSRYLAGQGRFPHQARERRQIEPDIGLKDHGLTTRCPVNGQALQVPPFHH
jgi:hypothetical protein